MGRHAHISDCKTTKLGIQLRRRRWWIDPGRGRFGRRDRGFVDVARGVCPERLIERELTHGVNGIGPAVVHLVRCHQTDAAMVVVPVAPVEEAAAAFGIFDAAKALREGRLYFKILKWLSENGLSFEVCGRLCERVTPRSAGKGGVSEFLCARRLKFSPSLDE
jgi:hypothetical protein